MLKERLMVPTVSSEHQKMIQAMKRCPLGWGDGLISKFPCEHQDLSSIAELTW